MGLGGRERRRLRMDRRRAVVAALGAAGVLALAAPGAFASNSPNASCVGAGSSALAPGQGFGTPGQRADVAHFINSQPGPGGQLVKASAQQKGTADQCFPAGPPGS
ncbi:MAG: hypothetical protein QOF47_2330 [Mycobacterium sp.]|nr:hypothetical protein [Mycobacterium sp.]